MAVTPNSIVTPQTLNASVVNFVEATDVAGTLKTLVTAGANGSKVKAILAATDDGTADHLITLYLTRSAVNYRLGCKNVPLNAGLTAAVVAINMLAAITGAPVDNDGQSYLQLVSGDTLRATFATALTAGKRVDLVAFHDDL